MAWYSRGEGRQTIAVTVIIGVFVAVLGIAFSLDIADWVKVLLVVIMAASVVSSWRRLPTRMGRCFTPMRCRHPARSP